MEYKQVILLFTLVFIVLAEVIAQYCVRKCKEEQKWHYFILGILMYTLVCFGLYNAYEMRTMGIINLLWSCLSIVSVILVGAIFFHDEITIYDIIGMIIVFLGFALIFIKDH